MALIRIFESDKFEVEYDTDRGMYHLIAWFEDLCKNDYWFDAYEEKEIGIKDISQPIKKFEKFLKISDDAWWCGYCPRCGIILSYNNADEDRDNRKQYCYKCGQLVEFK